MGHLTPKQKKELEEDIKSKEFQEGYISTQSIATKYGLSWKRAKDAINATKQRIEYARQKEAKDKEEEIPMETITAEQLREKELENQTPLEAQREAEERDEFRIQSLNEKKPAISLIETPKEETKIPQSRILDGSKFYCGNCLRNNREIVITTDMKSCPVCGGVLKWEN